MLGPVIRMLAIALCVEPACRCVHCAHQRRSEKRSAARSVGESLPTSREMISGAAYPIASAACQSWAPPSHAANPPSKINTSRPTQYPIFLNHPGKPSCRFLAKRIRSGNNPPIAPTATSAQFKSGKINPFLVGTGLRMLRLEGIAADGRLVSRTAHPPPDMR